MICGKNYRKIKIVSYLFFEVYKCVTMIAGKPPRAAAGVDARALDIIIFRRGSLVTRSRNPRSFVLLYTLLGTAVRPRCRWRGGPVTTAVDKNDRRRRMECAPRPWPTTVVTVAVVTSRRWRRRSAVCWECNRFKKSNRCVCVRAPRGLLCRRSS